VTVHLVGAGPGDPGLLTVRGAELLGRADIVLYDSLAEASLLDLAPAAAERLFVGKRPGAPMPQEEINDLLVRHGRAGRTVVRLKGGDPFVFGRGGEEAQALIEAGVPFEVVPGVTSAVAVPAYAGVPVTHRGLSTSFTVVTGHSRQSVDDDIAWEALATVGGTIIVLMGVAHRAEIASRLQAGGLPGGTPVTAVRWGTRPDQQTLRTTLERLGTDRLEPPATIVIGAVAGLDLTWFAPGPLAGATVVVTRARRQASGLARLLRREGAEVVELAAIEIVDPEDGGAALARAVAEAPSYDWVAFSSANAVDRLMAHLPSPGDLGPARVAAVGRATAAALARHGLTADLVPARFTGEDLVAAFPAGPGRVLFPRAAGARDTIPDGLGAKGWEVVPVDAYRTVASQPPAAEVEAAAASDAVVFTSSSTVTSFLAACPRVPPAVICIGPVTAATAREAGLRVDAVAAEAAAAAVVDAVVEVVAARRIGG
jgi:uroporphyrinogen III methyltransferase/synthase